MTSTTPTPIPAAASPAAVILRKTFTSRLEYAKFVLSEHAPRHSVTLQQYEDIELPTWLGVAACEALFSDDYTALCRAAVAWESNGFEVFIDKAADHPDYDGDDWWNIRANANVPRWFIEDVPVYAKVHLDMPIAEVEECMLDLLCYDAGDGNPLSFVDRETDQEYLDDILKDATEDEGWD